MEIVVPWEETTDIFNLASLTWRPGPDLPVYLVDSGVAQVWKIEFFKEKKQRCGKFHYLEHKLVGDHFRAPGRAQRRQLKTRPPKSSFSTRSTLSGFPPAPRPRECTKWSSMLGNYNQKEILSSAAWTSPGSSPRWSQSRSASCGGARKDSKLRRRQTYTKI